jgi:hypothetical protein
MIETVFRIYKTNPISLVLLLLREQIRVGKPGPDMGTYRSISACSAPTPPQFSIQFISNYYNLSFINRSRPNPRPVNIPRGS